MKNTTKICIHVFTIAIFSFFVACKSNSSSGTLTTRLVPFPQSTETAEVRLPVEAAVGLDLKVLAYPSYDQQVSFGLQRIEGKPDRVEFVQEHEKFKTGQPWGDLPLLIHYKNDMNNLPSDKFLSKLAFLPVEVSPARIQFILKMQDKSINFRGLWKFEPFMGEKEGVRYAAVAAYLCRDYDEVNGKYVCKGTWESVKEIRTEVKVLSYFPPNFEITDLILWAKGPQDADYKEKSIVKAVAQIPAVPK